MTLSYFENIFKSSLPNNLGIMYVLQAICPKVTEKMNEILNKEITYIEVYNVLQHLNPYKAPGPDEYIVAFFHSY